MRRQARQKTGSSPGYARAARLSAGLTIALMLALPATAWSDVPAAETGFSPALGPDSMIGSAKTFPGSIVPDTGTEGFAPASFDDPSSGVGGYVADALPPVFGKPVLIDTPAIDPFHARPPTLATDRFDWNALAKQNLGTPGRIVLSIDQQFASSTSFATAISMRHTAGPLDVDVALTGARSLAGPGRLALAYDSNALIAMTPAIRFGVTARGDLGAPGVIAPTARQAAGPVMQLRLLGGRTIISSDAGYDFALNSDGAMAPRRLHAKIDLHAKF